MSMTVLDAQRAVQVERSVHTAERDASWHEVEPGFWVGNTPGRFLGTVEIDNSGFIARDHTGVRVGKYSDAVEARAALSERGFEPGN